jgi:hypothetical protein
LKEEAFLPMMILRETVLPSRDFCDRDRRDCGESIMEYQSMV